MYLMGVRLLLVEMRSVTSFLLNAESATNAKLRRAFFSKLSARCGLAVMPLNALKSLLKFLTSAKTAGAIIFLSYF